VSRVADVVSMTSITADRPPEHAAPKPRLRGRIHQVAFIVSIPASMLLIALGRTPAARASTAVYGVALTALLGTSASYHRYPWSEVAHGRMQRLDHSMIFLLIAGTYTPFSVLALHGGMQAAILAVVWSGAAVGIALKLLHPRGVSALTGALYVTLGWAAIVAMPQFITGLPVAATVLMLTGGLLYTSGAVVLLRRKPDPLPAVFGYHEIWHVFVTSAVFCHYLAILILVATRH
jgi:hemolysin III